MDHASTDLRSPPRWPALLKGTAALLVLNALLSFGPWWPTPGVVLQARLAPELVGLWLLLLGLAVRQAPPSRRLLGVLSAMVCGLVLGRYADVTAPSLFGRPINVYWDLPQLPRFLWVSAADHPAWLSLAVVAAVVVGSWGLFALVRVCLAMVLQTLAPWATRTFFAWVLSFGAALLVAAHLAWVPGTGRWVSNAVLPMFAQQARLLWDAHAPGRLAYALPALTPPEDALRTHGPRVFSALAGRDLNIVFLESFGAVLYDHPEARAATERGRQALQEALTASGRQVVSGFFRSPTVGGASDLAHLSLLSGVALSDARRGNLRLRDVGPFLRDALVAHRRSLGREPTVKYIDPSYTIRSVPACPSDSVYCWDMARHAVHAAMAGNTAMLIGRWHGRFVHVPIALAIRRRRHVDPDGDLWMSVIESTGQPRRFD